MLTPSVRTRRDMDDGRLAPGSVVASKYLIDSTLGEGGMGVIYAATNLLTRKRVALKWMHPSFAKDEDAVARFLREARVAGSIDHPNVVNIFDVGREGETPFLVMELLRGRPLSDYLTEPMDAAALIELLMPALRGIYAAHRRGLVHRDLKPANIFICEDESGRERGAKVLDFGVSKSVDDQFELESLTMSGSIIGTPLYMSPEQMCGESELDARADVYAIGVILYQGLTGQLPFSAETVTALAVEVATGWLRPPHLHKPDLDRRLETVVMRALAREPVVRFSDVASLARELERFGSGIAFGDQGGNPSSVPAVVDAAPTLVDAPSTELSSEPPREGEVARAPGEPSREVAVARRPSLRMLFAMLAAIALVGLAALWLARSEPPARTPRHAAPIAARPDPSPRTVAMPTRDDPSGYEPIAAPPVDTTGVATPRPSVRFARRRVPRAPSASPAETQEAEPEPQGLRTRGVAVDDFFDER